MLLHSYQHLPLGIMIVRRLYHFSNIVSNNLFQIYTPDVSPKSSKVGAFLPHPPPFGEKSPFPGIKKAGRGQTLSGEMNPSRHFSPSEGAFLSIQPHILTFYQSKHAKITTQASYQNLGGYMANLANYDTEDDAHCRAQSRVHLHPGAYRAITVQMHRRSKGPDARCF